MVFGRDGLRTLFLAGKPLVQKGENLRHIELDVFEVEVFLSVLLHLEQVVEFEIKF